ncbi:MAG: MopE-related protein, partial [Myxococcota bacterium]
MAEPPGDFQDQSPTLTPVESPSTTTPSLPPETPTQTPPLETPTPDVLSPSPDVATSTPIVETPTLEPITPTVPPVTPTPPPPDSDVDQDGYSITEGDCDDLDPEISPDQAEVCDGVDQDCDNTIDDGVTSTFYLDDDSDGFGDTLVHVQACQAPKRYVEMAGDCNDNNPSIYPTAIELCNNLDDDCDGLKDEDAGALYYRDADGDGFGATNQELRACNHPSGYAKVGGDCDDSNPQIKPSAPEQCNGIDDDCDGTIDDGSGNVWYRDSDNDGFGLTA